MKIQSRFVLVLSLLSIIHFLFSCGICSKKVDCPGFDEKAFANWMPYQDNSILIFQDSLFEKDTFTLRNKLTSTPYTSNTYSENRNPCHSQKLLCSDEQDTLSSKMCINLQINTIKTATIQINGYLINLSNLTDTGFKEIYAREISLPIVHYSKLTLGSKSFLDVQAAKRYVTLMKEKGLYEIYISKNEGLIGYSEYPGMKTWVKQ